MSRIAYPVAVATDYHNAWPIFDREGQLVADGSSRAHARTVARLLNEHRPFAKKGGGNQRLVADLEKRGTIVKASPSEGGAP